MYHRLLMRLFHSYWVRAFSDVIFWLLQSLIVFYVLWRINEGELRFYIFLALLFGFFLYYRWGRASFLRWLERMISICVAISRLVSSMIQLFVIQPFRFVLKLLISSVMIIFTIIARLFTFIMKGLYFIVKPFIRLIVPSSVERRVRTWIALIKDWAFKNRRDGD